MPRPFSTPGGRPHRVSTALSDSEVADLDKRRGSLDRSQYLRHLVLDAAKRGVRFGEGRFSHSAKNGEETT